METDEAGGDPNVAVENQPAQEAVSDGSASSEEHEESEQLAAAVKGSPPQSIKQAAKSMSPDGLKNSAKAKRETSARSTRGKLLAPQKFRCDVDPGDCQETPTYRRRGKEWPTRCPAHKESEMVLWEAQKATENRNPSQKTATVSQSFAGLSSVKVNEGATKGAIICSVRNCKSQATWTLFENVDQTPMYCDVHGKAKGEAAHPCPKANETEMI